ncbi:hypothetical protein BVY01_04655 [bacterium I07]|nr:hypothetical protein BVY01_04655 [bacterium I07]
MGNRLNNAIDNALQGIGSFQVVDSQPYEAQNWSEMYAPFRGKIVFWPFDCTRMELMRFLSAVQQGVIPVMTSPMIPRLKFDSLKKKYCNWGCLEDDGSISGSNLSTCEEQLLFIATTSGSSGSPKFIAATSDNLQASVTAIHKAQRLENVESTAVWLPFFFNFSLINQLLWAVLFEKKLILLPGMKQAGASFSIMRETKAEMICWVNSQARMIQRMGFKASDALPAVKQVNFGGAPFPMHFLDYLREIFPNSEFINNYGCTEALSRMSMCRVHDKHQDITLVGETIESATLREKDGKLEFTGTSKTPGEVRNDGRIDRYGQWVPTGDMGYIKDGKIHVLGRYDQVFNNSGERLSLVEIEVVLLKIPGVENAYAWTVTPFQGEEEPVAVIQGDDMPSADDIRYYLKAYLPHAAWPKSLYWAGEWPLTDRGKDDRQTIKDNVEQNKYQMIEV